jgi:hypothetical protein
MNALSGIPNFQAIPTTAIPLARNIHSFRRFLSEALVSCHLWKSPRSNEPFRMKPLKREAGTSKCRFPLVNP